MSRVAIVGAGILGCLTALDLASQGIEVDLFDRNQDVVSEASFFNEGKIHLGFLYALDESRATPQLMIEGAARFRQIVRRLVDVDVADMLSTPFLYAVHRDSLVSPEGFARHLAACCGEFAAAAARIEGDYVDGRTSADFRVMSPSEWSHSFDEKAFDTLYETTERAVDPRRLAVAVRDRAAAEELISFHGGETVDRIERLDGDLLVLRGGDGEAVGEATYAVVANAAWSDLLRLDQGMGLALPDDWSYRYKLGNRVKIALTPDDLPSITVVLGAFGDLVNFGSDGAFLSWYPTGRLRMTSDLSLPDWNGDDFAEERWRSFEASRDSWLAMSPALKLLDLDFASVDSWGGGIILANGRIDVDHRESPLHARVQVGIRRSGGYFSVNTGKYTLGPMFAEKLAKGIADTLG